MRTIAIISYAGLLAVLLGSSSRPTQAEQARNALKAIENGGPAEATIKRSISAQSTRGEKVSESPSPADPYRLTLPDYIPAVVGHETNIYFDNVILVPNWHNYTFDVTCSKGYQQDERWTFVPQAADVGNHRLKLDLYDTTNRPVASAETVIRVVPADAGAGRDIALLIIGDSLTHASIYPSEIVNLFKAPGNPHLILLGTHEIEGTDPAYRMEGYEGWTFERFVTQYGTVPASVDLANGSSPFVFLEKGKPTYDFKRYVREQCYGRTPDLVTIELGCNDTFAATDENIEATINRWIVHADTMISGIREADPDTHIGLVMLVPPASSQDAFGANYQCGQTRWQYRRNQQRVVERMKVKYGGQDKERLHLIPAYVNLDTVHNYPTQEVAVNSRSSVKILRQCNGVHPAASGYFQMADSIYAWMKLMLK